MFFDRSGQYISEEDPGLVKTHGEVWRHFVSFNLCLIALNHFVGYVAKPFGKASRIKQLGGHRIDVEN